MSIQIRASDGRMRWCCARCEPRYESWGPWLPPEDAPRGLTSEDHEAMERAERQHDWDWHTPAILKASGPPWS